MKTLKQYSKLLGLLFALGAAAPGAQAGLLQIDFSNSGAFSGSVPSQPANPATVYATAIFDDGGGTGSVTLTMSVSNQLLAGAYVNDWYFNLDPLKSITALNFVSGTAAENITRGIDCCKADGVGGDYDVYFSFDTANPGQLARGATSTYLFTGAGLTAASFNFLSTPGNGADSLSLLSAIHVQGYQSSVWIGGVPGDGGGGGSTGVPLPDTLALGALGLLTLAVARRRRRI